MAAHASAIVTSTIGASSNHAFAVPETAADLTPSTMSPVATNAGTVRSLTTGAVSSVPDEDIQICVSVPVGDVDLSL